MIANKPIKQAFKKRYVSWKIRSDPGPGGKYKVERSDVIQWFEEAFEEVDNNLASLLRISKAFSAYGQDHRSSDQTAFLQYLAKHEENGVYKSLLENQNVWTLNNNVAIDQLKNSFNVFNPCFDRQQF